MTEADYKWSVYFKFDILHKRGTEFWKNAKHRAFCNSIELYLKTNGRKSEWKRIGKVFHLANIDDALSLKMNFDEMFEKVESFKKMNFDEMFEKAESFKNTKSKPKLFRRSYRSRKKK